MFDELYENLKKVNEQPMTMPATPVREPDVAPPQRVPSTPKRNPLKPAPNVRPKPKAKTQEVEDFLAKRKERDDEVSANEAFDPGAFPSFVHPDKENWITQSDEQLRQLLPELSETEQTYLEMISSQAYQDMLRRIGTYTGLTPEQTSVPAVIGLLQQSLGQAMQIESTNKEALEKMAVDAVLSLPEFTLVKDAYERGDVKFDAQLGQPELDWSEPEPESEDLTGNEEANLELAAEFADIKNAVALRRRMANMLIQGSGMLKTYLFNLVSDQLRAIDPNLPNMYGILAVAAQLGYWVTPDGIEQSARGSGEAGSSEVIPDGEDYIIKARALTFPFLVHELVKGIYEWVSIDPDAREEMGKETVAGETHDTMVGSEVFKQLSSFIPKGKDELMPLVHKLFLQLDPKEMKAVLAKGPEGRRIMADLVADAEGQWAEYQSEEDEL